MSEKPPLVLCLPQTPQIHEEETTLEVSRTERGWVLKFGPTQSYIIPHERMKAIAVAVIAVDASPLDAGLPSLANELTNARR